MGITDRILEDHVNRKGASGLTWFTQQDLARLGISEPLMTTLQNVQHVLRLRRSQTVVDALGRTDAFCIQETH